MSWRVTETTRLCLFCGRSHKVNLTDLVRKIENRHPTLREICDVCLLKFMSQRMKK